MLQLNNMEKPKYSLEKKGVKDFRITTKVQKVPMDVVSNYTIGETIGVGGFAKVHKAYHQDTQELVACKIIKIQNILDGDVTKIRREVQIHSKMKHPNIARIYEVVEKGNKIYIFMEYISHGQLYDLINTNGPLPQKIAIKIFSQILSAVCYLHDQDIVHRDIKPENIVLDKNMNAKLIDFGLAKSLKNILQKSETICGSPFYCAPEIVKKEKDYDGKSIDVWCLAVTLYAMLEAALPFDDDKGPKNLQSNIVNFNYHPPRYCSQESLQLFKQVFQPAQHRPQSRDLFRSPLFLKYSIPSPSPYSLMLSQQKNSPKDHKKKKTAISVDQKKKSQSPRSSIKIRSIGKRKIYDLFKLKHVNIFEKDIQKDGSISKRPTPIIPSKINFRDYSLDSPKRILD